MTSDQGAAALSRERARSAWCANCGALEFDAEPACADYDHGIVWPAHDYRPYLVPNPAPTSEEQETAGQDEPLDELWRTYADALWYESQAGLGTLSSRVAATEAVRARLTAAIASEARREGVWPDWHGEYEAENELRRDAEAEVERLRTALEEIVVEADTDQYERHAINGALARVLTIARRASSPEEGKKE